MTIYGESSEGFRVRPSGSVLFLVSTAQLVLCFQLAALAIAVVDTLVAFRSGWEEVIVVYAPFAADPMSPFFISPPLDTLYLLAEPIVAATALTLSLVLILLWPSGPSLATRLMIHNLAMTLVTLGALSLAIEENGFVNATVRTPVGLWAWRIGVGGLGLIVAILIERRANRLLANVFHADHAAERLRLWTLRIPTPLLAVAGLAWINGYPALTWASLAAIVITFLEATIHTVHPGYERIDDPLLRKAVVLTPLATLVIVGAATVLFGMKGAHLTNRVLEIEGGRGVIHEPVDDLLRKQLRDPDRLDTPRNVIRFEGKEYNLDGDLENQTTDGDN